MWVMTNIGFFSAVQDAKDPTVLVVRARCEADIRALCTCLGFPATDPVYGAGTDYPWRVTMDRTTWGVFLANRAATIDYTNFKGSVKSKKHHDAYIRVWNALLALEDAPPGYRGAHIKSAFEQEWEDALIKNYPGAKETIEYVNTWVEKKKKLGRKAPRKPGKVKR